MREGQDIFVHIKKRGLTSRKMSSGILDRVGGLENMAIDAVGSFMSISSAGRTRARLVARRRPLEFLTISFCTQSHNIPVS